ncbi:hypothetical protein [Streptomyces sp. NPDC018347]|uniref:hypothetical protein n=1 Tax=Streptomyces sp. NPDC018347 TaxID=3157193 RepID=UPI00340FE31D
MTGIQYFWRHPLAEQVRAEGREQGRQEGRVEGLRQMIVEMLEWRSIPVPDTIRERVNACTDLDQLKVWAQRAVHATDAAELFTAE